jgi:hypothetical protein
MCASRLMEERHVKASDRRWVQQWASNHGPTGFTISGAYWTSWDPPCVESDSESNGYVRQWCSVHVSDRLRDNGHFF